MILATREKLNPEAREKEFCFKRIKLQSYNLPAGITGHNRKLDVVGRD